MLLFQISRHNIPATVYKLMSETTEDLDRGGRCQPEVSITWLCSRREQEAGTHILEAHCFRAVPSMAPMEGLHHTLAETLQPAGSASLPGLLMCHDYKCPRRQWT